MSRRAIEPTRRAEFIAGMRATLPLIVGAIPFGIIYGALAATSGLSLGAAQGMSAFVFAGSAQFIAVGLIGNTSTWIIILTTFVVNLRHVFYSAALAPYMKHLPHRWLVPLGFWLTDESFIVVFQRYEQTDESPYKHWFFLGSAVSMYCNWQLCTFIGIIAGSSIPDPASWGLDFSLVVTFIGMLIPLMRNRAVAASVVVASVVAVVAYPLPNNLYLMLAALSGIVAGVIVETLWSKPETRRLTEVETA